MIEHRVLSLDKADDAECGGSTTRETVAVTHEEGKMPPVSRPSSRTLDLERWKYHQGHKLILGSTQKDA